jgi:N-acetylneuraminic acid mutarotase
LKQPAVLSASGAIDGQIIIVGGTDDAANVKGLSRATIAFDPSMGTTRELAEFPGAGFGVAGSAVVGGELFVFAGVIWDAGHNAIANTTDAHAFSLARNQWRSLAPYPVPVRGVTAVALDDHHIYLAGGYGADDFTDQAFVYDVTRDRYVAAEALPYRGQVGLVKCGDYVYCIGGEDRMKHRTDAMYRIRRVNLELRNSGTE